MFSEGGVGGVTSIRGERAMRFKNAHFLFPSSNLTQLRIISLLIFSILLGCLERGGNDDDSYADMKPIYNTSQTSESASERFAGRTQWFSPLSSILYLFSTTNLLENL